MAYCAYRTSHRSDHTGVSGVGLTTHQGILPQDVNPATVASCAPCTAAMLSCSLAWSELCWRPWHACRMLKAEKEELAGELEKAQAARKVLQEEKDKLLQELAR